MLLTTVSAMVLVTMAWRPAPRLIWNVSESVPVGLYRVHWTGELVLNELVLALPPEPLATILGCAYPPAFRGRLCLASIKKKPRSGGGETA
jgi:type IV secretory pathway protease TraF